VQEGTTLSWAKAVEICDEIPGIGRRVAEQLFAEVGVDMSQFRSAAHLASWAKLCPGNHESAGKRKMASIGKGNNWLRSTLVQAAHAEEQPGNLLSQLVVQLACEHQPQALLAGPQSLECVALLLDVGGCPEPLHDRARLVAHLLRPNQKPAEAPARAAH